MSSNCVLNINILVTPRALKTKIILYIRVHTLHLTMYVYVYFNVVQYVNMFVIFTVQCVVLPLLVYTLNINRSIFCTLSCELCLTLQNGTSSSKENRIKNV